MCRNSNYETDRNFTADLKAVDEAVSERHYDLTIDEALAQLKRTDRKLDDFRFPGESR